MCLFPDKTFHKKNKPIVTDNDYIVHKALISDINKEKKEWTTPFMFKKVRFNHKNIKKFHKVKFGYEWCRDGHLCINEGYHSWINRPQIKEWPSGDFFFKYFFAVIPKGTKIYIGDYGDIVSTKLIICKDEKTLYKYFKNAREITKKNLYEFSEKA